MSPESRNTEERAEWPGAGALAETSTTSFSDIQPAKATAGQCPGREQVLHWDHLLSEGVAPYLNSPSTTGGAFASHFPTAASCNVSMPLPDQAAETRPEQRPTPTPGLCKGERELHTRLSPAFSRMDPGLPGEDVQT